MNIEIKDVSKKFKTKFALNGINLVFEDNKINALIGFNGSGKSTMFNLINNFLIPDSGQILVGNKVRDRDFYQAISFVDGASDERDVSKVLTFLNFFANLNGLTNEAAMIVIDKYAELFEFKELLDERIYKLSKGNRQKIKLVSALLNHNKKYIFLDEPFDGLDPVMVRKVQNHIIELKQNHLIIITSHRMELVDNMADNVFILKEGQLKKSFNNQYQSKVNIAVNPEVTTKVIEKLGYSIIHFNAKEIVFELNSIDDFKDMTRKLLEVPNYKYHSLKQTTIANEFLKGENNNE